MQIPIRELWPSERPELYEHFLSLGRDDRRLRFGAAFSDATVREYVARIDFGHDALFGVLDDELRLLGVAHVARSPAFVELGVSVLEGFRGRGIGGALLARAHMRARNWGMGALFMHCLTENAAMMRLARRQGMDIVTQSGEADAWLRLAPADAASHFGEVFEQRVALFDYALKSQVASARRLAAALTPGTASRAPGR
ncbi:MAG TPA: GNAT family N-acetyltransferase [Burkholderiales bacterium]|jgi:GNAT superfamily N-acetyltransferase|nr:GNAT family N-acetyltransferase [Burkholderiales bacterium]